MRCATRWVFSINNLGMIATTTSMLTPAILSQMKKVNLNIGKNLQPKPIIGTPCMTMAVLCIILIVRIKSRFHVIFLAGFTNGNGPTMVALNPLHQKTMGQRDGPSFQDILLINRHYNCLGKKICLFTNLILGSCPSLACQNGGYPNPAFCSKCICPTGFSGTLCDQRPTSTNTAACTGSTLTATTSYQSLTVSLNRPFQQNLATDTCTYWIDAPAGRQIEIQLVQMEKYASCGLTSLEIKAEDMTLTGFK